MNSLRHFTMTTPNDTTPFEGIEFSDGVIVVHRPEPFRWSPQDIGRTETWVNLADLLAAHGQPTIDWLDSEPVAAVPEVEPYPCSNGLHDPQECDPDGYPPHDGCPECDDLAHKHGLTHSEVGVVAGWVHGEGLTVDEAVARFGGYPNS